MLRFTVFACIALASCLSVAAPSSTAAGKSIDIAKSAQICAGCHGANGKSAIPSYPHLAGQNKIYLEAQLKAFRSGERNSPIMSPMAKMLTDTEIKLLAELYSKM